MNKVTYKFSSATTDFLFDARLSALGKLADKRSAVLVIDENVYASHAARFKGFRCIVLKSGEEHKNRQTVDDIIDSLVDMQADRKTVLVGVGGGVVTDITGFVASIYLRGIRFGFVPTSLLAMVDAAIGGKNGIDLGVYKNLVGTIRQPSFLLYDYSLLDSLPLAEWQNGFAEIIKHACIRDAAMFGMLEQYGLEQFRSSKKLLAALVQRNAEIKAKLVKKDEFEQHDRKLLNFGHTVGHALEKLYELSHGQAVAIGMAYACVLSRQTNAFSQSDRVIALIEKYGLPANLEFDRKEVFEIMRMDKKRQQKAIHYVFLERIGKAVIRPVPIRRLEQLIGKI